MTALIRRPLWLVGAALSIGAGIIHFALGPEHLEELGALGFGFYVSGALQVGWAAALGVALVLPGARDRNRGLRALAWSGIAINLAILAAWAFSRIVGLPAGETPWTPEGIGVPDAIAGVLEVALVLGLGAWLRGWAVGRVQSTRLLGIGVAVALSAVLVGTVVAVTPSGMHDVDGHSTGHDHPSGGQVETPAMEDGS
jgi:hypothetical protein